jgi:translation initiation factor 2 subunit 2
MDYERLLEKGMKAIPKKKEGGGRFEIPRALIEKAGRRTIIVNVFDIASRLRRDPGHFIKFLLKELATKGDIVNQRLFVLGVFTAEMINRKIDIYIKEFVSCRECGKPDTKLFREGRYTIMKCEACGARHTLQ